jgi:endonuclease III
LASFAELVDRLAAFYGPLPAPPADAFGYFVWEVLGTKTTSGRRDAAMAALRRAPALTPDSLRKLPRGRLEAILRLCGPFVDERAAALDAAVSVFRRQPHFATRIAGPLREAWTAASDLPHLGRAGALRLLMHTGASTVVPVDASLVRLATRLGLAAERESGVRLARDVRRALDAVLPDELTARRRAVAYLAHHAAQTCVEASPHCGVCPIRGDCQFAMATAVDE